MFASSRPLSLLALLIAAALLPSLARAETRPNILLAIADDWSYGHAGAYDCPWVSTPAFDRVAREGLLFRNAFTPNAKCAPSRAIILTGRYSWQLEQAGNHMCYFPAKFGGYVERLAADGYFAGYTGKGWGPGVANDANGNPRAITGKAYSKKKAKPPTNRISNNDYAANFKTFLDDVPDQTPWVFWYGTTEPHRAYEYGSGVRSGKKLTDIKEVPDYWPDNETVRNDMLDYAVEVEHYDQHLGRIIEHLDAAGQLDNTLIVATSDHGMPFPRCKGQAYEDSNHIPLAIRWPSGIVSPGRTVDAMVDFTSLAPTFLKAAGVESPQPIMQTITGRDLFDLFQSDSPATGRDHVLVGKERHDIGRPENGGYPIRGIRKGDWLYLKNYQPDRWPAGNPETGYLNCDGGATKTDILQLRRDGTATTFWKLCFGKRPPEELYNVASDPDCINNLARSDDQQERLESLRDQMQTELREQGDPRQFGNGDVFERYEYTGASTDNFYDRFISGEKVRAGWVNPGDFEKDADLP
ncbi:sulfatase [Roseiconus nitratireducens]|uniref:Sulfatase n=1 Tax=Roseiconus nitratireducens TaxID=2605748 RepID=A0A5M6DG70_9BACT|nr:sulfatase [Roseiconus nitratireducens]KAA5545300.1 sulfatase [Roseiconus nitratireducens]